MPFLKRRHPTALLLSSALLAGIVGASSALLGLCGPFTDTAADTFCPFVLEVFYLGITTGTTATTYDPSSNVTRLQMATFLSRTVDAVLKRGGGRRAVAEKFWAPQNASVVPKTSLGNLPRFPKFDGADVWVSCTGTNGTVARVRASDGRLLETWTGAGAAWGVVLALGGVLVTGAQSPGQLYWIDPTQPPGGVTTVATNLGDLPGGIAFDGARVWTANGGGSVSIATPPVLVPPWTVTTVTTGFQYLVGALYDGSNVWVTDYNAGTLLKLGGTGAILQTVTVGINPTHPVFDGANLWVPNSSSPSVTVVRASNGTVLRTLTGNGLVSPAAGAFDGERILFANVSTNTVSLFKAADLSDLGSFSVGANPYGATSDGANFWIALTGFPQIARF